MKKKFMLAAVVMLAAITFPLSSCGKNSYEKAIEAYINATEQVKNAKSYEELIAIKETLDAKIAKYEEEIAPDFQPSDEQIERGDIAEKTYMQARHEAMSKISEERALNIIQKYTEEDKLAKSTEEIESIKTKLSNDLITIIEDFGSDFDAFSLPIATASEKLEKTIEEASTKF